MKTEEWLKILDREPSERERRLILFSLVFSLFFALWMMWSSIASDRELAQVKQSSLRVEEANYKRLVALNQEKTTRESAGETPRLSLEDVLLKLAKGTVTGDFQWIVAPELLNGGKLLSLEREPEIKEPSFTIIPLSIRVSGTPRQMVFYLDQLEALPELLKVDTFEVHRTEGGTWEWGLKLRLYFGNKDAEKGAK